MNDDDLGHARRDHVLRLARLDGGRIHGLPMHTRRVSRVTIYSQQVRALTLVHALDETSPLAGRAVVVIGGGICGATAAAAAALCGAKVTLFEQGEEILHFQRGCHTRYLHPRIFDWPEQPALHASAHLPIMNWSVGTAHEVAEHLVGQFFRIQEVLKGARAGSLEERTRTTAHVVTEKLVRWKDLDTGASDEIADPAAIIFARGFGVEQTLPGALPRSYWRVDSLSQTALEAAVSRYMVVVVGAGDGGVLDAIRAKVKNFDHGSFIDGCVQALEKSRPAMASAEEQARALRRTLELQRTAQDVVEAEVSALLDSRYRELPNDVLDDLDNAIGARRPGTQVTWITNGAPWSLGSQPLHRVLLWHLVNTRGVEHVRGRATKIDLTGSPAPSDPRYRVQVEGAPTPIDAHEVVLRLGSKLADHDVNRGLADRLAELPREEAFVPLSRDTFLYFDSRIAELGARPTNGTHRNRIVVEARITTPADQAKEVFTIEMWLKGCPRQIQWVEYDLHPEYGAITRRATFLSKDRPFRHWLHTQDDYWIRVRLSDGFEVGTWLSSAIERTSGQPEGHERWLVGMKAAATKIRGSIDYRAREPMDSVDIEPWLDSPRGKKQGG